MNLLLTERPLRILGLSLFLLFSNGLLSQTTPISDSLLSFKWKVTSFTDAAGEKIFSGNNQDFLDLQKDHKFQFSVASRKISEEGTWHVQGDSLVLSYELVPLQSGIDSLVYLAEDDESLLVYYLDGQEVARQSLLGLESKRRKQVFGLTADERGNLELNSSSISYQLSGRAKLIQSPFSLTDIFRGILGLAALLGLCWLFSSDRKNIDWQLVSTGIGLQVLFAILVLKVPFVNFIFSKIADGFLTLLAFTDAGSSFIFGPLADSTHFGLIFAFQILPIILFFSALTSLLYYLGILQKIVYAFAWVMNKTMKLSGAESLAAAGNIFLGQTESPLLVRPYLPKMTRSEIMALMTGGMATIAGSVFGAYIGFLGGADPVQQQLFATHLLTASIMSAPAALVAAKILVPETQEILKDLNIPKDRIGSNALDAITNGTTEGLKLAVNVAIMLLVFLALIKGINYVLGDVVGEYTGLNAWVVNSTDGKFSAFGLEYIFGFFLAPIAWLMGVPTEDVMVIGQLLGEKTVANEFVAYTTLGGMKDAGLIVYQKSLIIATYALCGFANFSSIGIQIGGIGALAPSQRKNLSELGLLSLLGGTVAAFLTAVLAGMLLNI